MAPLRLTVLGVQIEPVYRTVTEGGSVSFVVTAWGNDQFDYNVTFEVAGTKLIDEWFQGPGTYEYPAEATFPAVGVYGTTATIAQYPTPAVERASGEITVIGGEPPPVEYALTIRPTVYGTTNPPPGTYTFEAGSLVTVEAIPNLGNAFDYWLLDTTKSTENPATIKMDRNYYLQPFLKKISVVKTAEIDINFIRFPLATDKQVKNECLNVADKAVKQYAPNAFAYNPRLVKGKWPFQRCVLDVYEAEAGAALESGRVVRLLDPVTWVLIITAILGAVMITWGIVIIVKVRPLKAEMQEIADTLTRVIAAVEKARDEGKFDEKTANEILDDLRKARDKAEEAGEDPDIDWYKYLQPIFDILKYLPYIVVGGIALMFLPHLTALIPRPPRRA